MDTMYKFVVGKQYRRVDTWFDPVTVTRRTDKTIWVNDGKQSWSMRVRRLPNETEYAVDYQIPKAWRKGMTFYASNVEVE